MSGDGDGGLSRALFDAWFNRWCKDNGMSMGGIYEQLAWEAWVASSSVTLDELVKWYHDRHRASDTTQDTARNPA